jgi:hypothetical protein
MGMLASSLATYVFLVLVATIEYRRRHRAQSRNPEGVLDAVRQSRSRAEAQLRSQPRTN